MSPFLNIASYHFLPLPAEALYQLRYRLKETVHALSLKGTILLSTEGINLFLAGSPESIRAFQAFLQNETDFKDLIYKLSESDTQPFRRMLVRLKKEIIAFGKASVRPREQTAPYVSPEQLKAWYAQNKDMIVLDTRNDYEYRLGTFKDAMTFDLKHFRHFPEIVEALPNEMKKKTVVTFCTGGIRCEKAAEYMRQQGYEDVYQLEGGILNYFEKCGGDYYNGDCFVFDYRVALDPKLQPTKTIQCFACRSPVTAEEQEKSNGVCPFCGDGHLLEAAASSDSKNPI